MYSQPNKYVDQANVQCNNCSLNYYYDVIICLKDYLLTYLLLIYTYIFDSVVIHIKYT